MRLFCFSRYVLVLVSSNLFVLFVVIVWLIPAESFYFYIIVIYVVVSLLMFLRLV